jgi:hypothetical protein
LRWFAGDWNRLVDATRRSARAPVGFGEGFGVPLIPDRAGCPEGTGPALGRGERLLVALRFAPDTRPPSTLIARP